MVSKGEARPGRVQGVRVGAPDPTLTACSGLAAVAELVDLLDVVGLLDTHVPSIKQRDRDLSAGQVLVVMAQSQLL